MVYISKIYTRSGDRGQTLLADGTRVRKDAGRIDAYGDIDELNACIGWVRLEIEREPKRAEHRGFFARLDDELARIQQELFNLGAELATPGSTAKEPKTPKLKIEPRHVDRLEQDIDAHNDALEPLRSFVLPGGGGVATAAHVARTVCRRAERVLVRLAGEEEIGEATLRYVNRLSDYLFVVSRSAAHECTYPEVLWQPETV